jgi:MYXO-CTERM domain-containing protein
VSRTIAASVVVAVLALAPSAAAKGPHAVVEPGPGGIEPGKPWVSTLTLIEFRSREIARARPRMVLRSGSARFVVRPSREQVLGKGRYELSVVFPRAGRWSYTVVHGARRFEFPAAVIGAGGERDTTAFVAFPEGSRGERQGAGGPILGDGAPAGGGEPLPPEVVMPAAGESDDGGVPFWIAAAGLALAGAGTLTLLRRRRA